MVKRWLLGVGGVLLVAGCSSGPAASYVATVESVTPVNPGSVMVAVKVANISGVAGIPNCVVNVSDPSGAYTGVEGFSLTGPLEPSTNELSVVDVVVTNDGAVYATQATASCL